MRNVLKLQIDLSHSTFHFTTSVRSNNSTRVSFKKQTEQAWSGQFHTFASCFCSPRLRLGTICYHFVVLTDPILKKSCNPGVSIISTIITQYCLNLVWKINCTSKGNILNASFINARLLLLKQRHLQSWINLWMN